MRLGEIELMLDGEPYVLAPTFEAIMEIEKRSGKGSIQLGFELAQQKASLNDIAAIVWGGVWGKLGCKQASEMPWKSYHELRKLIFKIGAMNLYLPLVNFLSSAMTGITEEEVAEKKTDGSDD